MAATQYLRILILLIVAVHSVRADPPKRPFSVRDSIEMTTFSDPYTRSPGARCQMSPDGRHFLVVTTKGLLQADQLRSEIWLFDTAAVTAYLRDDAAGHRPTPRRLVQWSKVPKAVQYDSYGAVITKAQWASDGSSILFLAEQEDGNNRIYRVGIRDGAIRAVTTSKENVEDFSETSGTFVYSAKDQKYTSATGMPGKRINAAATDITGLYLANVLFPHRLRSTGSPDLPRDLWVRRGMQVMRINEVSGENAWHFPEALATQFRPSISPDGSAFIAAKPVRSIPATWRSYRFASETYQFSKLSITRDPSGLIWSWPWQYIYVDVTRHKVFPLVDAPSAMQAGYYDAFHAVWSPDGRRVLFTSTFLPLSVDASNELPCAAAVFTVADHTTNCVTFARFPRTNMHLDSAAFRGSSYQITLNWLTDDGATSETYLETNHTWRLVAEPGTNVTPQIEALVKQDINEPPSLWATDPASGSSKQLWDPNPQLASLELGAASIYRWQDPTGYKWTAGLLRPPNFVPGRRYPLVIQTHGFSNSHEFLADGAYTTGFAARPLAAAGMLVLQMGDRTDRHIQPATKEASLMALAFQSAIAHLDKDGLVDPNAVGIIGFSRSSWYVEEALISFPRMFKAATIVDGVDQSYMSYMLFCLGYRECRIGEEAANAAPPFGDTLRGWLDTAPGFRLNKVETPLRIETLGPMSVLGEWEIYSSLYQQGKTVDLIYIPHGQHILQKPLERLASQQGNVDWFISRLTDEGAGQHSQRSARESPD